MISDAGLNFNHSRLLYLLAHIKDKVQFSACWLNHVCNMQFVFTLERLNSISLHER